MLFVKIYTKKTVARSWQPEYGTEVKWPLSSWGEICISSKSVWVERYDVFSIFSPRGVRFDSITAAEEEIMAGFQQSIIDQANVGRVEVQKSVDNDLNCGQVPLPLDNDQDLHPPDHRCFAGLLHQCWSMARGKQSESIFFILADFTVMEWDLFC